VYCVILKENTRFNERQKPFRCKHPCYRLKRTRQIITAYCFIARGGHPLSRRAEGWHVNLIFFLIFEGKKIIKYEHLLKLYLKPFNLKQ
jgi:hypothetical protein